MKNFFKKLRNILSFVTLNSEKIPAELANEKLKDHFFKRVEVTNSIHKVVDGWPLYYNDELKKWRVSSLSFIWGHENSFINVVKIPSEKVPEHIKTADIDWST